MLVNILDKQTYNIPSFYRGVGTGDARGGTGPLNNFAGGEVE